MKKIFRSILHFGLALFTPWLVFLLADAPFRAFLSLAMQASIIGWLPASFWSYFHAYIRKSKK